MNNGLDGSGPVEKRRKESGLLEQGRNGCQIRGSEQGQNCVRKGSERVRKVSEVDDRGIN